MTPCPIVGMVRASVCVARSTIDSADVTALLITPTTAKRLSAVTCTANGCVPVTGTVATTVRDATARIDTVPENTFGTTAHSPSGDTSTAVGPSPTATVATDCRAITSTNVTVSVS